MILVTGATGFLGSELVIELCRSGLNIRCIKRSSSTINKNLLSFAKQIEWVDADMLDFADLETAFDGIDEVYHCAAMISFDAADKKQMIKTNVEGTANVVNLCLNLGVKKLLHVSSVAAIGKGKTDELLTEEKYWDAFDVNTSYAVSKYQSEMEVWRGIYEGLNAVMVNPSIIIGESAGVNGSGAIFKTIKDGFKYYTTGGSGFVDVHDVVQIMIALMNSDVLAERFIINAENYTYKKLFEEAAKGFGTNTPLKEAKPWMLAIAWRVAKIKKLLTGKSGGLTKDTAKSAFELQKFSNQKIMQLLNYQFKPIAESIKEITQALSKLS